MSAVQMNTRIDAGLKSRGDRVLAAMGITPSQAVRALWAYLAEHGRFPDQMPCGAGQSTDADDQVTRRKLEAIERGRALCADLKPADPSFASMPYKELRDALFDGLYEEHMRGEGA